MFRIPIFFFFTTVFAKLDRPSYEYILFEQFNNVESYPAAPLVKSLPSNAWVLSLSKDVEDLKLRVASYEEAKGVFGSQLEDVPNHRQPRMIEPNENTPSNAASEGEKVADSVDEQALLTEIMRAINKFTLTTHTEPDIYLGEEADDATPTLKLYFKGLHTSLVISTATRKWQYVISPSPFPAWFYQQHDVMTDSQGQFVEVPTDVASEFYVALLHLLPKFTSFPV